MIERKDAMTPIKLKFVADAEATGVDTCFLVPVYLVKDNQRYLKAWAERSDRLRGAREICIIGDNAELSRVEITYSKSDS